MLDVAERVRRVIVGGVSQAELARRSGVQQPTISRLLNDPTYDMRISTARSLAQALEEMEAEAAGVHVESHGADQTTEGGGAVA